MTSKAQNITMITAIFLSENLVVSCVLLERVILQKKERANIVKNILPQIFIC